MVTKKAGACCHCNFQKSKIIVAQVKYLDTKVPVSNELQLYNLKGVLTPTSVHTTCSLGSRLKMPTWIGAVFYYGNMKVRKLTV